MIVPPYTESKITWKTIGFALVFSLFVGYYVNEAIINIGSSTIPHATTIFDIVFSLLGLGVLFLVNIIIHYGGTAD